MKVGILTFHRASNYGTSLQAFATAKILQNLGVDAEIIDYRPDYIEKTLETRRIRDAKDIKAFASIIINKAVYGGQLQRKISNFLAFINTMPVSKTVCRNLDEVKKAAAVYDIILSGSDQLWNDKITGSDLTYFIPFDHSRKVSYASSFGVAEISSQRQEEIRPYLSSFDFITVREKKAIELVSKVLQDSAYSEHKIRRVVDPTLLICQDEWIMISNPDIQLPSSGYILTYYMIETPILRAITKRIRKETGLPIVNLKPSKKQVLFHDGLNLMWAGPRELLKCYSGARFVVTNSFHGTAFAINYNVPMYVAPLPVSMAGEVNSRLVDLLDWYGLSDRWIHSLETVDKMQISDLPEELSELKTVRREESISVLKKMIEGKEYE